MNAQTRKVTILILILAGLIFFSWLYYFLHLPTTMPIKTVRVVGQYHFVNKPELQKAVMPYVERGFFNVNVVKAEAAMRNLPGVKTAAIRRIWPDTVEISIVEKKPEARLNDNSFYAQDGTVFKPEHTFKTQNLPKFVGKKSDLTQINSLYKKAKQKLGEDKLVVTSVSYDALGSWSLGVNHEFKIELGKENISDRLQRFTEAYPSLIKTKPGAVLAYVDMRYHQGLAVKFDKVAQKIRVRPDST